MSTHTTARLSLADIWTPLEPCHVDRGNVTLSYSLWIGRPTT
jgi:hypothetical protein